jgi:hypothetical protein
MSGWAGDELDRIADVDELQLASVRRDGTLGRPVTIWVVRHGDDLYVRSWRGRTSRWFRGVQDRHQGHIRAGGVDKDVTFDAVDAGDDVNDAVDAAYRSKYRRYPDSIVDSMLHPQARATTLKLVPRATGD